MKTLAGRSEIHPPLIGERLPLNRDRFPALQEARPDSRVRTAEARGEEPPFAIGDTSQVTGALLDGPLGPWNHTNGDVSSQRLRHSRESRRSG